MEKTLTESGEELEAGVSAGNNVSTSAGGSTKLSKDSEAMDCQKSTSDDATREYSPDDYLSKGGKGNKRSEASKIFHVS